MSVTIAPPHYDDPVSVGYRFRDALTGVGVSVIAEVKRRSPSRGVMCADADAALLACAYQDGGAACLSVLTDTPRFGGSASDLVEARRAVSIPVLRKDFITTHDQVHETAEMGADALLLIVADLEPARLLSLHELALTLGLDVVTEVRTDQELETAVENRAYMIMVNQRNDPKDRAFTVDPDKAVKMSRLFDQLDAGIVKIAASGIGVMGGTPLTAIGNAGYDAALIGEALVTATDPAASLRALRSSLAA